MSKLIAIDPWNCGCTECLTGEYKPLRFANDTDIVKLLTGKLADHTSTEFVINVRYELRPANELLTTAEPVEVEVSCVHQWERKTWTIDAYLFAAALTAATR